MYCSLPQIRTAQIALSLWRKRFDPASDILHRPAADSEVDSCENLLRVLLTRRKQSSVSRRG